MSLRVIRKISYLIAVILTAVLVALFLLISPIAEFVIEKYSVEWTGRQVQLDNLRINLLNGTVKADNLKIFEASSNQEFVGIERIFINTDLYSFISGDNKIKEIDLRKPFIFIKQDGQQFNFNDLIFRFSDTTDMVDTTISEPVKYFLQNIRIHDGIVKYQCSQPEIEASLISLNLECKKIAWNDPFINLDSDFNISTGGKTSARFNYNTETADYGLSLDLKEMNIRLLYPYLRDYLFVKSLDGLFTTQIDIRGNADHPADIAAKGIIEIRNFSIVDTTSEQLAAVGALRIPIDSLNSGSNVYYFGNISIDRPYAKFAMYDEGYNFERIMAASDYSDTLQGEAPVEEYANIFRMMADYIAYFTTEYKISNYKANSFKLTNGELVYTDYTLEDKFQYRLDSLQLHSKNLNSADERLQVDLDAVLNTSGQMNGTLSVNPNGFSEMDIKYTVKGLMLSDINPYSIYYVATPFIDGRLFFENVTNIKNQKLKSENRLRIEQITVGDKVKNSTAMNLPVKLAVSLLKDLNGNINLNIPVIGDLSDPTYKWGKALLQVLKNIVIKAAVAPYRIIAGMFGGDEELYKEIRMSFLHAEPESAALNTLENLVKVLKAKPEINLGLAQQTNSLHEIEALALFWAKLEFSGYSIGDSLASADMFRVSSISNRDSLFNGWVDRRVGQSRELISVQEKVVKLYRIDLLTVEVGRLEGLRSQKVAGYFESNGIEKSRIIISDRIIQNERAAQTGPSFIVSYLNKGDELPADE